MSLTAGRAESALGRVLDRECRPSEDEGARYAFRLGDHELVLPRTKVTERQVKAVRRDEAEFALIAWGPVLVLCARFGDSLPWADAHYCWHLAPPEGRSLPPAADATLARGLLHAALIEGPDGRVRAERNATFSLDFTRMLHEAIREQARSPFDPQALRRARAELRRRCPGPASLVAYAAARTFGSQ